MAKLYDYSDWLSSRKTVGRDKFWKCIKKLVQKG